MTAKEYLSQYEDIVRSVQLMLRQMYFMRDFNAHMSPVFDDVKVQSSGSSDRMAIAIEKVVDMENSILDKVSDMLTKKKEIEFTISNVKAAKFRLLLEARYICMMGWQDIADMLHVDIRTAFRMHGEALSCVKVPP